jgi:hypothetical protein
MTFTTEQLAELLEKHPRIVDLLRYCRHHLLDEKLITQDEFISLLSTEGTVPRLETYDKMRRHIEHYRTGLDRIWRGLDLTLESQPHDVAKLQQVAHDYLDKTKLP